MNTLRASEILFLGTAASIISLKRNPVSFILKLDDNFFLMECGEGTTRRLIENGIDLNKIKCVFISHAHADHVSGIITFLWHSWLMNNRKDPLEIIAPSYVHDRILKMLELTSTPVNAFNYPIIYSSTGDGHESGKGVNIELKNLKLAKDWTVLRTHAMGIHVPPSSAIRLDVFKHEKLKFSLCYSGDTAPAKDICNLAKDCDILIHEATYLKDDEKKARSYHHCTAYDAGKIAQDARAKQLVIVHYSNKNENKTGMIKDEAKDAFDGPVIVADDGLKLPFNIE
ncbi:MAG: MBL fold metallo-hydrolase [Promethearchaeota archaeon]